MSEHGLNIRKLNTTFVYKKSYVRLKVYHKYQNLLNKTEFQKEKTLFFREFFTLFVSVFTFFETKFYFEDIKTKLLVSYWGFK
jgi:hypothetical protein